MPRRKYTLLLCILCGLVLRATGRTEETDSQISGGRFTSDVLPVFKQHCHKCHTTKTRKGGLDLQTISGLARGGESGEPVVVAGDSSKSRLLALVRSGEMPPGDAKVSLAQIRAIAQWVDHSARSELPTLDEGLSSELLLARRVHFLFEVKCQPCHGRKKQEAELDMRTMASLVKGGKSGPALVRGKASESLLVRRIHEDQMPPRDVRYKLSIRPVSETEQELIRQWIDNGAVDPPPPPGVLDDEGLLVSDDDKQWWSFQTPVAAAIPNVADQSRVRTPIDAFVLKRLEAKGISFSVEADRRVLVRRAYIDLLGLPPSPEEAHAFLEDAATDSFERLIDRLLSSPRYGERWGQHWLDAAGYADSEGSASADTIYPLVYQYRDYVIRALNADKPYDRFLLEQVAGDELLDYRKVPRMTRELKDNLIATGYLRTCIDPTTSPETNFLFDRYQVLADTVEVVSSSLMGLTMRCARCHSHKYDPLPQRDYYRFTAIFAPAYDVNDWIKPQQRTMEMAGVDDRRQIAEFNATINNQIHPLNLKIAALDKKAKDYKQQKSKLETKKKQLESQLRKPPQTQNLTDIRADAAPFYLLRRGEWNNRGRRVLPEVPAALKQSPDAYQVTTPFDGATTTGSRLALAKWLTRSDHPLTARVMVNRIWQHHFGRGIVATAEDFGKTGVAPTHPELLDWLAVEFVRSGWSIKRLHRLIMTSSVWRQGSRVRNEAAASDPENRLLWRMPLRRMDAEVVRDSMLAAAGKLNAKMYGGAVGVKNLPDGQVVTNDSPEGNRRSIYLLHRRSTPVTVLEAFDAPRLTTNCLQRRTSNVVSQALLMLNSGFADKQAEDLARKIASHTTEPIEQIRTAYVRVLGRPPDDIEVETAREFLRKQAQRYGDRDDQNAAPPKITSRIGMHASKGITFDLRALREAHPKQRLDRFSCVAALGYYPEGAGDARFYVHVDGRLSASGRLTNNTFKIVEAPLTKESRFLTLITSSSGTMDTDWTFFGNPRVTLSDPKGNPQTLDLADVVGGGDGGGNGSRRGINPWNGNPVTEQAEGTSGAVNEFQAVAWSKLIDGVFVPDGGNGKNEITITSTGIRVKGVASGPKATYDHIWNGHNHGVGGLKTPSFAERNAALVDLCLVLLNSAEFLYTD